jgi:hypothetical protein
VPAPPARRVGSASLFFLEQEKTGADKVGVVSRDPAQEDARIDVCGEIGFPDEGQTDLTERFPHESGQGRANAEGESADKHDSHAGMRREHVLEKEGEGESRLPQERRREPIASPRRRPCDILGGDRSRRDAPLGAEDGPRVGAVGERTPVEIANHARAAGLQLDAAPAAAVARLSVSRIELLVAEVRERCRG